MNTLSLEQLQQFISDHNINRVNDMLMFEGIIYFSQDDLEQTINSGVQIIMLPKSAALYILEFLKDHHGQNEMYSTSDYQFKYADDKTLQINNHATTITISISTSPEL